jgi:hypothetical protein
MRHFRESLAVVETDFILFSFQFFSKEIRGNRRKIRRKHPRELSHGQSYIITRAGNGKVGQFIRLNYEV